MHAAIVAQGAGENAHLVQVQPAQARGWHRRPVKIEHAVGCVDADDQLRVEAAHLLVEKAGFRLRQGFRPRPAPWVTRGALFPVNAGIALPVRGREISVEVDPTGIDPGGRPGQHAIRIEHRHKAPMDGLRRLGRRLAGQANPVQHHRRRGQFVAMNGPNHQHPHRGLGRHDVAGPDRPGP